MGRPKSEDPGILISFRIPKSLYAWWEMESEAKGASVSQLVKHDAAESAKRGLAEIERGKGYARLAEKELDRETDVGPNKWCAVTVPLHLTDELRMREAEASAQLSEESPFKTRKPKQEEPVDLMTKLEESLAVAKAEKDRRKTLARKTVTPNFKKDKK